jgi:hypothetical protein
MGVRMPETCWAVFKRQVINLWNYCIWLVDSFECMMIHGLANPEFINVPSLLSFCSFINVQHSDPYKDIISAVNVTWNFINLFFGIPSFFDSFYFCINQTYFKQLIFIHLPKILCVYFYENLNFLLAPTTARHSSVSWASWVSSLGPYNIFIFFFCNNKSVWHWDSHATTMHPKTKKLRFNYIFYSPECFMNLYIGVYLF